MKVTMLLCDSAQVADGKLYILGGGWSFVGPDPAPMALAIKVDVPWTEGNVAHHWVLELTRPGRHAGVGAGAETATRRSTFEASSRRSDPTTSDRARRSTCPSS